MKLQNLIWDTSINPLYYIMIFATLIIQSQVRNIPDSGARDSIDGATE